MPAGLNTIMNKYELLKKAWEDKKLQEVEKLLLELKIEFACSPPANERVSECDLLFLKSNNISFMLYVDISRCVCDF